MREVGVLILICGLPGAGKTTLAKRLEISRCAVRFCPDEWIENLVLYPTNLADRDRLRDPVENLQWDIAKQLLTHGHSVVLENGFWGEDERYQYAMEAIEVGAKVELYYLPAPNFESLWNRVEARNQSLSSPLWMMSREDLVQAWNSIQEPDDEELAFYDDALIVNFDK